MKRLKFSILLLLLGYAAYAQLVIFPDSLPNTNAESKVTFPKTKNINYNIELGTGYIGSKYFSGAFTSITPRVNFMPNSKLNIEAGSIFMMNNVSFNSNSPYGKMYSNVQPTNQSLFFANGEYTVNKKITITGTAFKSFNMSSNNNTKDIPYLNDLMGINIGLNYKITDNIKIGAQIEYSNRFNNTILNDNFGSNFTSPNNNSFPGW